MMMKAIALAAALATAAAQVTIEVEISAGSGWVVNPGDAGYPDIAANVGDTISFTYSSSYHDVVRVGNTDCDLSAATIVDETGSYQYVVQASDGAQIIFACGRGNHCASGQQVTVNVASGGGGSCPADITADGRVNVEDILSLLSQFGGAVDTSTTADINGDVAVGVDDLLLLLAAFGSTCAPTGTAWSGEVARLSFEEADAHLNSGNGHLYVDFGSDYNNRIASTIVPHELTNAGQYNPVSYTACTRGTAEVGFKTFFDGANANTDTGGRWNIDSNLLWYWNHGYIRGGTCGNCETDPTVDTTASSTDVPLSPAGTLKWRESCDWDSDGSTGNTWADSFPVIDRDAATGGINVQGLCGTSTANIDYDGDSMAGGAVYVPNGQFNGKPRYTLYYNGHTMEIFWAPQHWGFADGNRIGVIGDSTTAMGNSGGGAAPDGQQYFMLEDTDGIAHVETDDILLTGLTQAQLDMDLHIESTGWENNDFIRVWAEDGDGMADVVLLDARDNDDHACFGVATDAAATPDCAAAFAAATGTGSSACPTGCTFYDENAWVHLTGDISGFTSVTVKFSMSSNSVAEEMWIDNIVVTGSGLTATGGNPNALNCAAQNLVTLGMTSFEEPVIAARRSTGKYYDTLCTSGSGQNSVCDVAHYLINNADQNPVAYTGGGATAGVNCDPAVNGGVCAGTEMGFNSFYTPTRALLNNVVGLGDGDDFGVIGDHTVTRAGGGSWGNSGGGPAPDGTQYLMVEDTDGQVMFTFDTVVLTGVISATASVQMHIESTSWESADVIQIWCENRDGRRAYLFSDFDMDSHVENSWFSHQEQLPSDFETCTLTITVDTNSAAEEVWFDMIKIEANVPTGFVVAPLIPVVTANGVGCIMDGMDYGGGGACGYAPVITIIADHADWPAPGWYTGLVVRDSAMTSPQQCQVLCQQEATCDFFSYEWEFTNGAYYHECYLKVRDTCRDGQPDEYVRWTDEDPAWNGASGPKVCTVAAPVVTYAYTSFEEPIAPVCPGLSQGQCDATFNGTAAECATGAGCSYPNLGIDSHSAYDALVAAGTVDSQARYVTNYVAGTNGAAELGFTTFYLQCGVDSLAMTGVACDYNPNTDQDNNGVIAMSNSGPNNQPPAGSFNAWGAAAVSGNGGVRILPHGSQCFMIDDADGFVYVALDPVDLAAFTAPTVSAWTHIDSTGYESTDAIRVWAECSDGTVVDIVAGVLDDAAHPIGASGAQTTENQWIPHIAAIPTSCGTVTVRFGCQTNSNAEECWFDMIEIVEAGGHSTTGSPTPPPAVTPVPPPAVTPPATVGPTYQYTSFENPPTVQCNTDNDGDPTTMGNQGQCGNAAMLTIGADCAAAGAAVPCPIPSLAGIDGTGVAQTPPDGGYTTAFASTGDELGFTSYWEACVAGTNGTSGVACGHNPNSDRDNLGVMNLRNWGARGSNGMGANAVTHGDQVYMIDDPDGFAYVTLDAVDLSAMANPVASIWTHIDSTGYEPSDAIRVWVTCAAGNTIDIVAGVLDDNAHPTGTSGSQLTENNWVPHIASLAGCGTATLSFGCQMNSGAEECWFDLVEFYDMIPPATPVTSPTYAYTSFEEPLPPNCPGLDQSDCGATFNAPATAGDCTSGTGCLMGNIPIREKPNDNQWIAAIAAGWNPAGVSFTTFYTAGTNGAAELGFQTFYIECGADSLALSGVACGFTINTDTDNTGVIGTATQGPNAWGASAGSAGGAMPHGDNCFMIDDADGFIYVALDPVDLAAFTAPTVSAWTHIDSTGYESTDAIRVWAECSDGTVVDVVAGVLDDNAHPIGASGNTIDENQWIPHIAALPATCGTVTVKFGCQMNSAAEECWFDMIEIVDAGGHHTLPATPCTTGIEVVADTAFSIDVGGTDLAYSNNMDCSWQLSCTDPAQVPVLTFSRFELELDYDYLYVYDGTDLAVNPEVTLHGLTPTAAGLPASLAISGQNNANIVRFTSDGSVAKAGFNVTALCGAALPDPCTGVTCQNAGTCQRPSGTCECVGLFSGDLCEIDGRPTLFAGGPPNGAVVSATYQYTSFENVPAVECSSNGQGACGNLAMTTIAADCAASGVVPCPVPSLAGIAGSGSGAGYATAFTSTGDELGFTTYYENCVDGVVGTSGVGCDYNPNSDGDNIGVIGRGQWGAPGTNGDTVLHGNNVYMIDDPDGFVYVTLDAVDLSAMANPIIAIWTHIDSTSYEPKDAIRVWATCTGGATVEVVSGVLDDNAHPVGASGLALTENRWIPHVASLAGCGTATLSFGCQTNSAAEECWFDMIEFYDAAHPNAPTPPPSGVGSGVVINEIHYNPQGGSGNQGSDGQYEYIELWNGGAAAVDIGGWTLGGLVTNFPAGTQLAVNEYMVVSRGTTPRIEAIVPTGTQVLRSDSGSLSNSQEDVVLTDGANNVVDAAHYDDGGTRGSCGAWDNAADGNGASLERVLGSVDGNCGDSWLASCNNAAPLFGTPGAANCDAVAAGR